MSDIRYDSGKLLMMALFMALPCAIFLWILASPETFLELRGRRVGIVHFLADSPAVTGALVLFFGYIAVRAVMACGAAALAVTPTGLEIRTIFARHAPPWRDLAGTAVETDDFSSGGRPVIRVNYTRAGKSRKVRIHSGLLDIGGDQWPRFLAAMDERLAARAFRASAPAQGESRHTAPLSPAPLPSRAAGFGRKRI